MFVQLQCFVSGIYCYVLWIMDVVSLDFWSGVSLVDKRVIWWYIFGFCQVDYFFLQFVEILGGGMLIIFVQFDKYIFFVVEYQFVVKMIVDGEFWLLVKDYGKVCQLCGIFV